MTRFLLTDAERDADNLEHAERFDRNATACAENGDHMGANIWRRLAQRERQAIENRAKPEPDRDGWVWGYSSRRGMYKAYKA